MKNILFVLFALCASAFAQPWSGILSTNRAIDWSTAGLPSCLAYGTASCTSPNPCDGATKRNCTETLVNPWTPPARVQCVTSACNTVTTNGGASTIAQINSALASAFPGSYVLLPAGTYSMGSNIIIGSNPFAGPTFNNGITLRGSGPMSTIFNVTGSGTEVQFAVCCDGLSYGLLNATSYSPGNNTVTITGATCGTTCNDLAEGNLAWLEQCDTGWSGTPCASALGPPNYYSDPWPSGASPLWICGRDYPICTQDNNIAGNSNDNLQQFVLITHVTSNGGGSYTVTFTPGMRMPLWSSNNTAKLYWRNRSDMSVGIGLENMTFHLTWNLNERLDFGGNYGSWITGVRVIGYPTNSIIQNGHSARALVMSNYIFSENPDNLGNSIAEPIVLGGGTGAGTSDNLYLNNFENGAECYWANGSRTSDVLAYSYCRDNGTLDYSNVSLDHGVEDDFTLHEGNSFGRLQSDNTHGTHNLVTWFRNYISGEDSPYQTLNPSAITVADFQRMVNVVGNALGGPKSSAYQTTGTNNGEIFGIRTRDSLTVSSLMRWGNVSVIHQSSDTPANSGIRFVSSEVPTSLTGNAVSYQLSVPGNTNLPPSFFLPTTVHANGGTGLSWWKTCDTWSSTDLKTASCTHYTTPPFPPIGPDVTGGQNVNGYANNIPVMIAQNTLPIDTTYQSSFSITASQWSNNATTCGVTYGSTDTVPCEILTVNTGSINNGSNMHIMGGFQTTGANWASNSACRPTSGASYTGRSDLEILMSDSSTTTITYALASSPEAGGSNHCTGTLLFPDVRQFDSRVYQTDSASSNPVLSYGPTLLSYGNQVVQSTSASQQVTLTNTGTAPLTLTSIVTAGDFSNTTDCGASGASLGIGASCHVVVTFTPLAIGTRSGTVTITDDAAGSPHVVTLSGTGTIASTKLQGKVHFQGNVSIGPVNISPTTYLARWDQCELGNEAICPSQRALSFLGCNTWSNGTYTPNGACGTAPNIGGLTGANTIITEPDFNSKVSRVTDSTTALCGSGAWYSVGSNGAYNFWSADSKKFMLLTSGGATCVWAFSADSTMVSTPSQINGTQTSCPGNTGCTGFLASANVVWTNRDPNSMFELDVTNLTLYRDTITNPTADPSTWVFDRVKLFNFLQDCSGKCGLPSNFVPNYSGTLVASDDDSSVSFVTSDDGQDGPPKDNTGTAQKSCPLVTTPSGSGRYGDSFMLNWTSGKGWRSYSTCGYPGQNSGNPYITGSWGDSGTPTTGICAGVPCTLGTSGGSADPDAFFMHEGGSIPDSHYSNMSASANNTGPGSCSGAPCVTVNAWEIATTNMRPCTLAHCNGHNVKGRLYHYDGAHGYAHSYHDQSYPDIALNAFSLPNDQHGTYSQVDASDRQPIVMNVSQVCDVNGTPGGTPQPPAATGPCIPSYDTTWYNEIIGIENSAANPSAKHCDYGGGPNSASCVYRFGQSYNTGTNSAFQIQNSIGNIDDRGHYLLFTSDWNLTLGCTNGWTGSGGQKCLDPVTASNGAVWGASTDAANWVSVDGSNNTTVTFASLPADGSLWSVGMYVKMTNLVSATFLNNQSLFITSVGTGCHSGSACFTGTGVIHASYSASDSAGKATWTGCTTNYTSVACPRGDVFIMDLQSAHP